MDKTLIIIKPDAMKRKLMWKIMQRFEDKGLNFCGGKLTHISRKQIEKHYEMHKEKSFFENVCEFMTSYPVFIAVLQGENVIEVVRNMIGATKHLDARMGTIRGDFALGSDLSHNIIHASDSIENANREISLFFNDNELFYKE